MTPSMGSGTVPSGADPLRDRITRLLSAPEGPDRPFVLSGPTRGEVLRLAAGLAHALPPEAGAVCLATEEKGLTAAALLAALATGTHLILPHAMTPSALAEVGRTLGIPHGVTDRPEILPPEMAPIGPSPDAGPRPPLVPAVGPDTPLVAFFTGGTTGAPKRWSKTPGNLLAEALSIVRRYRISPGDRILATIPPYHIYGFLFAVLAPLVAGAAVAPETPTFPEEIRSMMADRRPTLLVSVPVHYRLMNGASAPRGALRLAVSSAGKLAPEDAEAFHRETGVDLVEIYGSTETGGVAARCRARGETALTPIDEVAWRIDGDRLRVRSPFISPDIETDAEGFFLTGDRVAPLEGGRFHLLGRADSVVKVGGKRVDLEAVREILLDIEGVTDAAVIARPAAAGRETDILAVYQGEADPGILKGAVDAKLGTAAVPRRLRRVDRIPVSSSGKLDHRSLDALFRPPPDA